MSMEQRKRCMEIINKYGKVTPVEHSKLLRNISRIATADELREVVNALVDEGFIVITLHHKGGKDRSRVSTMYKPTLNGRRWLNDVPVRELIEEPLSQHSTTLEDYL